MKIINIIIGEANEAFVYKDPGMIIYSLARYCGYDGTHAFLNDGYTNDDFEQYGKLLSMGKVECVEKYTCIEAVRQFIIKNIKNYDIAFFFNYGSTNYKMARLCKKYNPNIKVYCKLDMGESGFKHFYEDGQIRKLKNYFERLKSKYVDLFTVETKYYYDNLKDNIMFSGGRLKLLPNGVSLLGVDLQKLDSIKKENILLTVGRLGIYEKNNEMLLKALTKLDKKCIADWKFYFVGPMESEFVKFAEALMKKHDYLKDKVIFTGNISNRMDLYSLYARSKIICMTSRSESFCISTVEGMYFGCVPFLTNYGHIVYDQTDNKSFGRIVNQDDIEELSRELAYYIKNCALLEDERKICQNYARENYDYKIIAKKLDGFLKGIG